MVDTSVIILYNITNDLYKQQTNHKGKRKENNIRSQNRLGTFQASHTRALTHRANEREMFIFIIHISPILSIYIPTISTSNSPHPTTTLVIRCIE